MKSPLRISVLCLASALLACRPGSETDDDAAAETDDRGSETGDTQSGESSETETSGSESETGGDGDTQGETQTETGTDTGGELPTWRSVLYPEDWVPGFGDGQGRLLHDFSYAGYHNSELPLPDSIPGVTLSVLEFGADPSGTSDSNAAIQATIDAVAEAGGGVVELPAGSFRCDDLLEVTTSGVVIRGAGADQTQLWFTRAEAMTGRDHLSFRGVVSTGAELPLSVDGEALSHDIWVADADPLAVGDSVSVGWVISDPFIEEHEMTGTWVTFNGQWRPFFRRQIEAIDCQDQGCRLTLDVPLRYPALLRDQASVRIESGYLDEVGVEALSVSTVNSWSAAWALDRSHAIAFVGVADGWMRDIESFESPNSDDDKGRHLMSGGLFVGDSKRVTVADSLMALPQHRGPGGNGYLFEISRSSEVLTRDSAAFHGRHNFIQNWDFGTSGCVWMRVHSEGGVAYTDSTELLGYPARSEYHHSLAMANLVDDSQLVDGWSAANRNSYSSGAGHSATQNVFWNVRGLGTIRSFQFGWGYVIGTQELTIRRLISEGQLFDSIDTEPEDWLEGEDMGASLSPGSLFEDQLARRLNP